MPSTSALCRRLIALSTEGSKTSISASPALSRRYAPWPCLAISVRPASSSLGSTMAPLPSLRKPPPGAGMGAPCAVPTPSTVRRWPASCRCLTAFSSASRSSSSTPSVISKTPPCALPACLSKSSALPTARSGREPWAGIKLVEKLCSWLMMVFASVVSGLTTKASAANTISAVSPSFWRRRISVSFSLARSRRLGLTSSASIERDRSNSSTRADSWRNTGTSSLRHAGPARARMARAPPTRTALQPHGFFFLLSPINRCGSSLASTTLCQLRLARRCRHISHRRIDSGIKQSSHAGRRK